MSPSAEVVVREFISSWENMSADVFAKPFSDDCVYIDTPRFAVQGVEEVRAEAQTYPDTSSEIKNLVSANGTVIVERVDRFDYRGKRFELPCVGVFEVDDAGRIKRFQDYYDMKGFIDQVAAAGIPVDGID